MFHVFASDVIGICDAAQRPQFLTFMCPTAFACTTHHPHHVTQLIVIFINASESLLLSCYSLLQAVHILNDAVTKHFCHSRSLGLEHAIKERD